MTVSSVEELAEADWTEPSGSDLPPYKSLEFFDLLGRLGVTLEEFRRMPVYQRAVDVQLIVDDEWASVDVSLPPALRDALRISLSMLQAKRLYTSSGIPFTVVDAPLEEDGTAVTVREDESTDTLPVRAVDIEAAAELWLGGGAVTEDNMAALGQITGDTYQNLPFVVALLNHIEPGLFAVLYIEFVPWDYPVYERLVDDSPGGTVSRRPPVNKLGEGLGPREPIHFHAGEEGGNL